MRFAHSLSWLATMSLVVSLLESSGGAEEPFRPKAGAFPPLSEAHAYRGELVFVDHANRRGSVRVEGMGTYFRNAPHPIALLPYGIVRYHAAPADLRDIPLGSMLHVRGFLPPDPKISAVPVLPINNRDKTHGYSGKGVAPAENHVLLLEDEPSYCRRNGLIWKLNEVELSRNGGTIVGRRVAIDGAKPQSGDAQEAKPEKMTLDAATRIWRGRERLLVQDLVDEGRWPKSGTKSLGGQPVLLGITWKPTPSGVFTQFHISDIWLDDEAMDRTARLQTETHKAFIRSRWMPAWVDAVEYGKFGHATVTATLFGGMDPSLYADFKKDQSAMMSPVENTLKHNHGAYGPSHMACKGPIKEVVKTKGDPPVGSSGIQIRFETDLILEGVRPGRVVRVSPTSWPRVNVPREEYLNDGGSSIDARFPSPAIFPKY